MRVKYIDLNGIRTRVLYEGHGPAVFLLHGIGLTADTFARNIDALGSDFTVYAPDLLGHGFTDAIDYRGRDPQLANAQHVNALAEQLGLQSYSALGSSFGALVAALMWFEHPANVKDLVLVGSGSAFHPQDEQERTLRASYGNFSAAMANLTLESCRRRLAAICYDPAAVPDDILPVQLTAYARPGTLEAYTAAIEGVIASLARPEARILSRLEQITARTLILTGHDDLRSKWSLHVDASKRMPDAELVIFEKCGHLPYLEHPRLFNDAVRGFLSDKTTRSRESSVSTVNS